MDPVIVIGGGQAGAEAALASARLGVETLLVTLLRSAIGRMPCNPAIGGAGKGHLVREIDALGGGMADVTDATTIQFKTLNDSRGLGARGSRAQVDRWRYARAMARRLESAPNLRIVESEVLRIEVVAGRVSSVVLRGGERIACSALVVTAGTALRGAHHVGSLVAPGGGGICPPARGLSECLADLGHAPYRLKTGTVPRLDGRTIDWERLPPQEGDRPGGRFSFVGAPSSLPQIRCAVTATNAETHAALRDSLRHSPMHGEDPSITGRGPRYCPSVEDKVLRFPDKDAHRIFLEPEGLDSFEVYPNGFSTSLPVSSQAAAIATIPGLEAARIVRPGYAIEYDAFDARLLSADLASRTVPNLLLAGQVNGTTGYEEAAGQGLVAGTNAARIALSEPAWVPRRDEAYLGVMVDDLTRLGAPEPYRMFTSRAEFRLLLREDNADLRLTPVGRTLGLVDDVRWAVFARRRDAIERGLAWMEAHVALPAGRLDIALRAAGAPGLSKPTPFADLLRRDDIELASLLDATDDAFPAEDADDAEQVEIQCRYAGYLARERQEAARLRDVGHIALPTRDWFALPGLRRELAEKLTVNAPGTIGEAARIPGMTPTALALLAARMRQGSPPP
jgi:tRNA uridine 5-carboxymethylaminomethyl modification enzyme